MSRASKATLLAATTVTCSAIYFVHRYQETERSVCSHFPFSPNTYLKNMHEGVIRDEERQRIKQERMLELQEQQRLQKEYEKVQPVSRSNGR